MLNFKQLLFLVLLSCAYVGIAQACYPLKFNSVTSSASTVSPGAPFTVSCDYGVKTDSIGVGLNSGACIFKTFNGTAAVFSCVAPNVTGLISASCTVMAGTGSNNCSQVNPPVVVTVGPIVTISSGPAPGITCAQQCKGIAQCLSDCTDIAGGGVTMTSGKE